MQNIVAILKLKNGQNYIDKYVTATRSEIVELSMVSNGPFSEGLPADKKANLWREKLAYIMQDSKLFRRGKQEVKNHIWLFHSYFYSQVELEEAEEYAKKWINHMQTTYNWDNDMVYYHIFTWLTAEEYEKVLFQESIKSPTGCNKKWRLWMPLW